MGSKTLVYKQKVTDNLNESYKHLLRLENAFEVLKGTYLFPIDMDDFQNILARSLSDLHYNPTI